MSATRTSTQHGRFRAGDPLYARAYELADAGRTQEEIAAALAAAFPGLPNPNYYQNPAAIAVMARVRREQQEDERAAANSAWRRQRGLPAARTEQQEAPVERPPWTDCDDDPDWHGPLHAEVDSVRTAGELLALCARYNLTIRHDAETGEIVLSRRIAKDSALYAKLKRLKPLIIDVLTALERQRGVYAT